MKTAPNNVSRRDVLKKGAVAGAAFWAVPVIESVTSKAAAASGGGISCAYAIVVYEQEGCNPAQYFVARYSGGQVGCDGGPNENCTFTRAATSVPGVTVSISPWSGTGPDVTVYDSSGSHAAGYDSSASRCGVGLTQSGDTVTADRGYKILTAFAYGSSTGCVQYSVSDNCVTLPAKC
jgi:hypothetical protein